MLDSLGPHWRSHWPEYLIEAAGLGLFMISACVFGAALGHPGSPVVRAVPDALTRRGIMGLAMGLTAVALIYSPWGQRSGAHFNPATTLTFWRLGKVATPDAALYALAQATGGLAGVVLAAVALGPILAEPSVDYVVTVPGALGPAGAFVAEAVIAFTLMSVVLAVSNTARIARFTGLCAGALVFVFIALEAPISGMSMNPARSFASAVPAAAWEHLWIYFTAPPLGMLLAAQLYASRHGLAEVFCAKLHHGTGQVCVFRCRFEALMNAESSSRHPTRPA